MKILENVNASHSKKPSKMKKKETKQKAKRDLMRQIANIFGGMKNGGTITTNSPNSPEMAGIILTRWAKRRLAYMKEKQLAKPAEVESANQDTYLQPIEE